MSMYLNISEVAENATYLVVVSCLPGLGCVVQLTWEHLFRHAEKRHATTDVSRSQPRSSKTLMSILFSDVWNAICAILVVLPASIVPARGTRLTGLHSLSADCSSLPPTCFAAHLHCETMSLIMTCQLIGADVGNVTQRRAKPKKVSCETVREVTLWAGTVTQ
jgi:hypothetical protein